MAIKPREIGPGITHAFIREALHRALVGVGPLTGAAAAAVGHLKDADGDIEAALRRAVDAHVRYAGAQGFATNVGGLVTAPLAIPANVTGLALVQCRMIAAIVHLRGYDLDDPRVRNAILLTLLGEDAVTELVAAKKLPAPPMAIATAPMHDPSVDPVVSAEIASNLIARVAGKRLVTVVGRRVPLVGGLVGAGVDGVGTWQIGHYAIREFLPRLRRVS